MADRTIGNYVLGPILGRGGMSVVHAAEHRFLGDRAAIKLLRSQLAADPAATAAFIAEATRTRAIDHPAVIRVIDVGSDGDELYLVMEQLDGESLAARLARGRLDEPEARRLGAAIADGAAAAHDRGIVHRDLKPGNIMLVGDQPKIIDFGIAREVCATITGSRLGTVAYMAPEQLTGGLIAPCVDIWALGVVLYEALAGRLPFDGFADGRSPQLFETPPRLADLADVSPALEALIASCLEREPGKRPASMCALAAALRDTTRERLTEDLAPSAGRRAPDATIDRWLAPSISAAPPAESSRRRRRRISAAIAALAIVATGSLWLLRRSDHDASAASSEPIADRQPNAASREPSTAGRQPIAASREPSTASGESSTAGREPSTASGEPSTAGREPSAAGREASTADRERAAGRRAASFTVEVRSAPPGAHVLLGGKRVGVTPTTIALEAPASITVTRAGYRSQRIRAERAGAIDVRLVPARPAQSRRAAGETLD
jgi:serine/threonine-protein kinase